MTVTARASRPSIARLFNHCAAKIGPSHIHNNVPNDPGSAGYDDVLRKILTAGSLPSRQQFEADWSDLSETFMSLGGRVRSNDEAQFRRFRMFAFSIALDATDRDFSMGFSAPFLSVMVGCLLTDVTKLRDQKAYAIIGAALAELEIPHPYRQREEIPFLTLGILIASRLCGTPYRSLEPLGIRLSSEIKDAESHALGQSGPEMFWAPGVGASMMRDEWREMIREYLSDSPSASELNWLVTELLK